MDMDSILAQRGQAALVAAPQSAAASQTASAAPQTADPTVVSTLAADPTVVAARARRVQVKLTAERLMGDRGLPYLMQHAPQRLHISKRRSAQQNLSSIVNVYQLWAHDLYPKANFKDFLKLCHTLGKSDKVLREYRTNLVKREMYIPIFDEEGGEEPSTIQIDTAAETAAAETQPNPLFVQAQDEEDSDEEVYTLSNKTPRVDPVAPPAPLAPTQEDEVLALEREMLNTTDRTVPENPQGNDLEEDEDALQEMRELGY